MVLAARASKAATNALGVLTYADLLCKCEWAGLRKVALLHGAELEGPCPAFFLLVGVGLGSFWEFSSFQLVLVVEVED